MAIARGAGTEIIRSGLFEQVNSTAQIMIVGIAHHVYTVLSIICHASSLNADTDYVYAYLVGYDAKAGTSGQDLYLFQNDMSQAQTYVWNDKFSFNGNEPTDFSGPLSTAAMQDAIADQAQATAQNLTVRAEHGSDAIDVTCTFIDQNNA